MTEIYLIRHTQAQGNRYRMMQGSWDGEITELGRQQIEALAERFSTIQVDAVYSSDLSRAIRTAEAAARHGGLPIQTRTALRELDEEDLSGDTIDETNGYTEVAKKILTVLNDEEIIWNL